MANGLKSKVNHRLSKILNHQKSKYFQYPKGKQNLNKALKNSVGTTIATTLYSAGVTVRIKLKETTQIGEKAFLEAMLDCLHLKDPYAKIIPKPTEQEETQTLHFALWEHEDINNTDNFEVYIDDPIRKKNKEYAARIYVKTSILMYQFLGDDTVQSW